MKLDYFNIKRLKGFSINIIVINEFHYFKTHYLSRNHFSRALWLRSKCFVFQVLWLKNRDRRIDPLGWALQFGPISFSIRVSSVSALFFGLFYFLLHVRPLPLMRCFIYQYESLLISDHNGMSWSFLWCFYV